MPLKMDPTKSVLSATKAGSSAIRGIIELRVKQNTPSNITLKVNSHECSVDLKKDLGVEKLFNKMSFDRQILLAIQFI